MRASKNYFLRSTIPNSTTNIVEYLLSKYSCGGATVICGRCAKEFPLCNIEINKTELDNSDRRMVWFKCPICGNEESDMLDIRAFAIADGIKKKYLEEKDRSAGVIALLQ